MKFTYAYLQTCALNAQKDPNYSVFKDELILDLSSTNYTDFNIAPEADLQELGTEVCKVSIQDLVDNPSFCSDNPCDEILVEICKLLNVDHGFISVGQDPEGRFVYSALVLPVDEFQLLPVSWKKTLKPLIDPDIFESMEESLTNSYDYYKSKRAAMPVLEQAISLCLNGGVIKGFSGWMDE